MMKIIFYFSGLAVFLLVSCTPCQKVAIDSYPPGAMISLLSSSNLASQDLPPTEHWSFLGYTPLTASACLLTDAIKASWEGRELLFPEYHGSNHIHFDFEKDDVMEE